MRLNTIFAEGIDDGEFVGSIDLTTDLELIQQSVEVSPALVKSRYIELPCANGSIDTTSVDEYGTKFYQNRTITWKLTAEPGAYDSVAEARRTIGESIHGQKIRIYLQDADGDNMTYFYYGRPEVQKIVQDGSCISVELKATVEPFEYETETEIEITSHEFSIVGCAYAKALVINTDSETPAIIEVSNPITLGYDTYDVSDFILSYQQIPGLRLYPSFETVVIRQEDEGPQDASINVEVWKGRL